jgi:hypothetical protein
MTPVRVLAYINHYYGESPGRKVYLSARQSPEVRRRYVEQTIASLQELGRLPEVECIDIKVCGITGKSLVPIDVDFPSLQDPRQLIFESLATMSTHVEEYDYFINIEDDILLPAETFRNVLDFDAQAMINEILHPNRIEVGNGRKLLLDPILQPRVWTFQQKQFKGVTLRVAVNPHSGVLILSQAKFRYCVKQIDVSFRGHVIGAAMESAFAHFHKPFSLYRPYNDLGFHTVIHQDKHHPYWSKWETLKWFFGNGGFKYVLQARV